MLSILTAGKIYIQFFYTNFNFLQILKGLFKCIDSQVKLFIIIMIT